MLSFLHWSVWSVSRVKSQADGPIIELADKTESRMFSDRPAVRNVNTEPGRREAVWGVRAHTPRCLAAAQTPGCVRRSAVVGH